MLSMHDSKTDHSNEIEQSLAKSRLKQGDYFLYKEKDSVSLGRVVGYYNNLVVCAPEEHCSIPTNRVRASGKEGLHKDFKDAEKNGLFYELASRITPIESSKVKETKKRLLSRVGYGDGLSHKRDIDEFIEKSLKRLGYKIGDNFIYKVKGGPSMGKEYFGTIVGYDKKQDLPIIKTVNFSYNVAKVAGEIHSNYHNELFAKGFFATSQNLKIMTPEEVKEYSAKAIEAMPAATNKLGEEIPEIPERVISDINIELRLDAALKGSKIGDAVNTPFGKGVIAGSESGRVGVAISGSFAPVQKHREKDTHSKYVGKKGIFFFTPDELSKINSIDFNAISAAVFRLKLKPGEMLVYSHGGKDYEAEVVGYRKTDNRIVVNIPSIKAAGNKVTSDYVVMDSPIQQRLFAMDDSAIKQMIERKGGISFVDAYQKLIDKNAPIEPSISYFTEDELIEKFLEKDLFHIGDQFNYTHLLGQTFKATIVGWDKGTNTPLVYLNGYKSSLPPKNKDAWLLHSSQGILDEANGTIVSCHSKLINEMIIKEAVKSEAVQAPSQDPVTAPKVSKKTNADIELTLKEYGLKLGDEFIYEVSGKKYNARVIGAGDFGDVAILARGYAGGGNCGDLSIHSEEIVWDNKEVVRYWGPSIKDLMVSQDNKLIEEKLKANNLTLGQDFSYTSTDGKLYRGKIVGWSKNRDFPTVAVNGLSRTYPNGYKNHSIHSSLKDKISIDQVYDVNPKYIHGATEAALSISDSLALHLLQLGEKFTYKYFGVNHEAQVIGYNEKNKKVIVRLKNTPTLVAPYKDEEFIHPDYRDAKNSTIELSPDEIYPFIFKDDPEMANLKGTLDSLQKMFKSVKVGRFDLDKEGINFKKLIDADKIMFPASSFFENHKDKKGSAEDFLEQLFGAESTKAKPKVKFEAMSINGLKVGDNVALRYFQVSYPFNLTEGKDVLTVTSVIDDGQGLVLKDKEGKNHYVKAESYAVFGSPLSPKMETQKLENEKKRLRSDFLNLQTEYAKKLKEKEEAERTGFTKGSFVSILEDSDHAKGYGIFKNKKAVITQILTYENDFKTEYKVASEEGRAGRWFYASDLKLWKETGIKTDATKALYRVGAAQLVKATKAIIVGILSSKNEASFVNKASQFLDSEIGEALTGTVLSLALSQVPKYKDDPRVQNLAKELQISSMALAGNMLADTVINEVVPQLVQIFSALPEETIRIAETSEEVTGELSKAIEEDEKSEETGKAKGATS